MAYTWTMGFNAVAFVARETAALLLRSPKTTANGIYYNYTSSQERWRDLVENYAKEFEEPPILGLYVPGSWHASGNRYFKCSDEGVWEGEPTSWMKTDANGQRILRLRFKFLLAGPWDIAFVLNDILNELKKCPLQVAYMLSHPAENAERDTLRQWRYSFWDMGFSGEDRIHPQQLDVVRGNPPGKVRYFVAGGNCLYEADVHQQSKRGDVTTIRLYTPEEEKRTHVLRLKLGKIRKEKGITEFAHEIQVDPRSLKEYSSGHSMDYRMKRSLEDKLAKVFEGDPYLEHK